jgi:PAS domain S-box-containing protein
VEKGDKIFHFRTKYLPIVLDDGRSGAAVILENVTETHQIQQKYEGIIKKNVKRTLRDDGEEQLAHSPSITPNLAEQTPAQLIHELQVHQIELETQAEELRKSKIALEESRDRFVDLYEFAPLGYLTLTEKALITEVNLTGAKLLGVARDKLINHGLGRFIAPKDNENWDRYFADVRQHGEKQSCTLTLKRSDGSTFPARLEGIRLTDSDDTITVRIAFSDITDIRKAEAALRDAHDNLEILVQKRTDQLFDVNRNLQAVVAERAKTDGTLLMSDEQLALAIERTGVGLWDWYVQTGKTTFNERWAEIVGYTLTELQPISIDTWINLCHPDDLKQSDELLKKHFRKESQTYVCEARIRHKDGHWVWVLDLGMVIEWDSAGLPIRMTGTHLDITDRKEKEEVLQRQSASLTILNGIITAANKADNLPQLFKSILTESLHLLDFDAGGIYLVDHSTRTANVVHSENLNKEFLAEIQTVSIDKKPYDTLFIQNEQIITENYAKFDPDLSKKSGFQSISLIPLLSKGVAIGALNLASTRKQVISDEEKQSLISISRELGSTIERMAAEEEVKKAKENLETLFNSIDEMVFVLDMQGNILAVNDAVLKRLSYTQRELTGTNVLLLHVPERQDEALRIMQGMIAGTIDSCTVPVLAKDGTRIEVETKVTRGWWNGNEVLIGVTRDITERKRAEEVLLDSETKHRALFEAIADTVFLIDQKSGNIIDVNLAGSRIFGYSHDEFIRMKLVEISEEPEQTLKSIKDGSTYIPLRYYHRKDGSVFPVEITASTFELQGRTNFLATIRDISERKRVEKALAESESFNRNLVENLPDYVVLYGSDGKIIYVNPAAERGFGYNAEEVTGTSVLLYVAPECRDEVAANIAVRRAGGDTRTYETVLITHDGQRRTVLAKGTLVHYHDMTATLLLLIDITDRKVAEVALRESEEKYRVIFNNEIYAILIFDIDTKKLLDVNDAFTRMYGYTRNELLSGMTIHDITVEHEVSDTATEKARSDGTIFIPLRYHKKKDGTIIQVEIVGGPYEWKGKKVMFALFHDITDRIRAEERRALLQSQFQNAMDVGNLAWWEMDCKTGSVRFYKKKAEMLGYPPEQFSHYTDFTRLLHPDDHDRVMQAMRDHFTGKKSSYETEYRIKTVSGEYRWFWDVGGISEYDASGKPVKVMGIVIDITGRKVAEELLHLSDSAVISSISAIAISDLAGNLTYVNPACLSICGYEDQQELLGRSMLSFMSLTDEAQKVVDSIQKHGTWSGEMTWQKKDGTPMQIFVSANLIRDASGSPVAMMGSFIDVTGHKQMKMALHEGEQQYRALFDTITEGVVLVAPEGQIVSANPAAEYILGLTHSEIEGRKYDSPDWDLLRPDGTLMPPKEFASARAMKEKCVVRDVVMGVQRPDGSVFWISVNAVPLLDETGALKGGVVTFQNITERKRTEEELLQLTQQLSLLTDITRHDILNKVTEVLGHLNHARKTFSDPEITALIDTIETNTKEIKSQIEFTRMYQTLGTLEPQWQNPDYLISQLHVPSHITLRSDLLGVEIFADPLFRQVFFNLFDNSQRHGGHVTTITVSMEYNRFGLIIYIEDNGVGIPAKQKKKIFERGFKKSTGLGLFLTQEILRITGIKIKETGIEGSGARFEIAVPKGAFRDKVHGAIPPHGK